MKPVVIREDEMTAVMDALSQYLDNAVTGDDGEPIETPEFLAVARLLGRLEAALEARLLVERG